MKNMYVSMGLATDTTTEMWFSQAKDAHVTEPTYVSLSRPVSASRPTMSTSISSARPASASTRSVPVLCVMVLIV